MKRRACACRAAENWRESKRRAGADEGGFTLRNFIVGGGAFALTPATALAQEAPRRRRTRRPLIRSAPRTSRISPERHRHSCRRSACSQPAGNAERAPQAPTKVVRPATEPSTTLTDSAATTPAKWRHATPAPRRSRNRFGFNSHAAARARAAPAVHRHHHRSYRRSPVRPWQSGSARGTATAPATFAPAPAAAWALAPAWLLDPAVAAGRDRAGSRRGVPFLAQSRPRGVRGRWRSAGRCVHRAADPPRRPPSALPNRHRHRHLRRDPRLRTAPLGDCFDAASAMDRARLPSRCAASSTTNNRLSNSR